MASKLSVPLWIHVCCFAQQRNYKLLLQGNERKGDNQLNLLLTFHHVALVECSAPSEPSASIVSRTLCSEPSSTSAAFFHLQNSDPFNCGMAQCSTASGLHVTVQFAIRMHVCSYVRIIIQHPPHTFRCPAYLYDMCLSISSLISSLVTHAHRSTPNWWSLV